MGSEMQFTAGANLWIAQFGGECHQQFHPSSSPRRSGLRVQHVRHELTDWWGELSCNFKASPIAHFCHLLPFHRRTCTSFISMQKHCSLFHDLAHLDSNIKQQLRCALHYPQYLLKYLDL
eukprot:scaffold10133_cov135-Skeletonema_menzelii.AAC.3